MSTEIKDAGVMKSGPWCLAFSFLLIGIGYALPVDLWPWKIDSLSHKGLMTMNLYVLTAWMGLAHFIYTFKGQFKTIQKQRGNFWLGIFLGILVIFIAGEMGIRSWLGVWLFDGIVWFYFIAHFIKAEMYIDRVAHPQEDGEKDIASSWSVYLIPLITFGYFSLAILAKDYLGPRPFLLFSMGLGVIVISYLLEGWKDLQHERRWAYILVAAFLVGEGLLWGRYAPYMDEFFADGVYAVHVSAASFFHYLRSYEVARRRPVKDWMLSTQGIILINLGVIMMGIVVSNLSFKSGLDFIFSPEYFTVWVLLHLLASDVFGWFKKKF